jgi:hypothetical protein
MVYPNSRLNLWKVSLTKEPSCHLSEKQDNKGTTYVVFSRNTVSRITKGSQIIIHVKKKQDNEGIDC